MSSPELIRQTVQNPIVRQLMMNPSVLNDLISAHPHATDWLKVLNSTELVLICCRQFWESASSKNWPVDWGISL